MNATVDANVVKAFYHEEIGVKHNLTASPGSLFERQDVTLYFDVGGHVYAEYCNTIDPDWLRVWFEDILINGRGFEISVGVHYAECRHLHGIGFPKTKDIRYVRLALTLAAKHGTAHIVSEDVDFFDPSKKGVGGAKRVAILRSGIGPIAKQLRKGHSVFVKCVEAALRALP